MCERHNPAKLPPGSTTHHRQHTPKCTAGRTRGGSRSGTATVISVTNGDFTRESRRCDQSRLAHNPLPDKRSAPHATREGTGQRPVRTVFSSKCERINGYSPAYNVLPMAEASTSLWLVPELQEHRQNGSFAQRRAAALLCKIFLQFGFNRWRSWPLHHRNAASRPPAVQTGVHVPRRRILVSCTHWPAGNCSRILRALHSKTSRTSAVLPLVCTDTRPE